MVVAYLRVSTELQDVAAQKEAVKKFCAEKDIAIDKWLRVEVSSRKSLESRGIAPLLLSLKPGDTLIVSEISRLARSVGEIALICDTLLVKRVRLICIKERIDLQKNGRDLDIQSLTMVTMFGLFAQIERTVCSQRTREGMAAAKARGSKIGNPNLSELNAEKKRQADEYAEGGREVFELLRGRGMTMRRIAEELNDRKVPARNGGKWGLQQVQRVMKRLGIR